MWDTLIIAPFINALLFIYQLVGQNFAVAIILFTILIRLLTHPLMVKQIKGAQAMQELQKDPRYVELQKKYANDKQKLQAEQAKLIQELKINPFSSCLPTLIQFPIIIGLYQAITQTMASAPLQMLNLTKHIYPAVLSAADLLPLNSRFLWMDLGQPERLIIPGLSFGIPVLALIVMATTFLQGKLSMPASTTPTEKGKPDQGQMMTSMMNIYMPIFMGWLALTLASGLAIYFVASNLIGIAQYAALGRINWKNLLPSRKSQPAPRK